MAKTKFFRVALEGATTDGRSIDRNMLIEMAQTYNTTTYQARVNMEHIRGVTAEPPFQSLGDVLSLKTEEVTIELGGKPEKRLALFAELDVLDPLIAMNKKGQKLFTSVEINPNMAGTGKAYLMGLAVTDSPASLGTEMLKFAATQGDNSPLASRKQVKGNLFAAAEEAQIEVIEAAVEDPAAKTLMASITDFFTKLTGTVTPPVVTAPAVTPPVAGSAEANFAALQPVLTGIGETLTKLSATVAALTNTDRARATEFAALKATIETTPKADQVNRSLSKGGDFAATDC